MRPGADLHVVLDGNPFSDNHAAVRATAGRFEVLQNEFDGGGTAIEFADRAEGRIADNVVRGAWGRGISIEGSTSPALTGNTVCNNAQNLVVADEASPLVDGTNEICEDASGE